MRTIRQIVQDSLFARSLSLLSRRDKLRLRFVVVVQMLMGFLDLVGVAFFGILGALAVNGVQSRPPGERVARVLQYLQLDNQTLQTQAAILGSLAVGVLLGKTLFSAIFSRKTLYFLSRKSADLTYNLLSRYLTKNLLHINEQSTQKTLFALTNGVSTVMVGIIGATVSFLTDFTLLVIMVTGLLVVDVRMAIAAIALFTAIGLLLYYSSRSRAQRLGTLSSELTIASNEKILELLSAYREIVVRNRRYYYAKTIGDTRVQLANIVAEISFLPSISKYAVEIIVLLGGSMLAIIQFALLDATHAIATLTVFMAAGSRITPALLRLQQSALTIKGASGLSSSTLQMVENLKNTLPIKSTLDAVEIEHQGFDPLIKLDNVSFTYPGGRRKTLSEIDLTVEMGKKIAIVGPSGSGKTTLVDLILGIIPADSGTITISGVEPLLSIETWPGAIAYVPQDVMIFDGSILENIALGFPSEPITESLAKHALQEAQLIKFVENLPEGIHTKVGNRGMKLSGGQRQRLGIARALFTRPKLIILDEATSALDGQTESNMTSSILGLDQSVTVLMIAHRLSTVRDADLVIYIEQGEIRASGSFEEVRAQVPDFDSQAKLMGL